MNPYLLKFIIITVCLVLSFPLQSQINLSRYSTSFRGDAERKTPIIITARRDEGIYTAGMGLPDAYPNLRNEQFEEQEGGDLYDTCDSSEVHFFAHNIFRQNAHDYVYRVLENRTREIQPWQPVRHFLDDSIQINNFKQGMAYLGGYKTTWNNYLILEIKEIKTDLIVSKEIVYWQQIKPELLTVYTGEDLNLFLKRLKKYYNWDLSSDEKARWAIQDNELDSLTLLPKKLIFAAHNDQLIFYLKTNIFERSALEYQLIKNHQVVVPWQSNEFDNNLIWLKELPHGAYVLSIRFAIQRHNVTQIPFSIRPFWWQTTQAQFAFAMAAVLVIFASVMLFRQRLKLRKAKQEKLRIINELQAIRSQLNPHFVFNALNSIQGLIHQNDLSAANYYLTTFSTLLRDSLHHHTKEFVPLSIELKTLDRYIKLENLRFPFTYSIDVDPAINPDNIEIPYLLLQPIVENAIKHGISGRYQQGILQLRLLKRENNLLILISDNGKGMPEKANLDGYGLKLTRERLRLLNQSNPKQAVELSIETSPLNGTSIKLTFNDWLN